MKPVETLKRSRAVKELSAVCGLIRKRKVAANAAGLSFYLFLSMIPLLILLCSLLPYTGVSAAELTSAVTRLTPEAVNGLLTAVIEEAYASRVAIFSLSFVFLLWSATKLTTALTRSLDEVFDVEIKRGVFAALRSLAFTATLVLLAGAFLLLAVRSRSAEKLLPELFRAPRTTGFWTVFEKKPIAAAVCLAAFALLYTFVPSGKRSYLRQLPGAAAAAAGVTLFSLIFSVYSAGGNIYNSFYGSLTAVALLLFYVYICFRIFLSGGVLNAYLAERSFAGEKE